MSSRDPDRYAVAERIVAAIRASGGIAKAAARSRVDIGEEPDIPDTSAPKLKGVEPVSLVDHKKPRKRRRKHKKSTNVGGSAGQRSQASAQGGARKPVTAREELANDAGIVAGESPARPTTHERKQCGYGSCMRPRVGKMYCAEHAKVSGSSMVEPSPVKRKVAGSIPALPAKGLGSSGVERRAEDAEVEGSTPSRDTTEHEKTMEAARKAQVGLSKGENGKKRKASVERYLYQFMHGHGTTVSRAYKDNWDRIFGKGSRGKTTAQMETDTSPREPNGDFDGK